MSHNHNSTQEFLQKYETANTFNLGGYLSNLFQEYGVEAAFVLGSILAGLYLVFSGVTILGLGLPFIVFVFVYLYVSYRDTQSKHGWPPTPEECPNGFYKDLANQDTAHVLCNSIAGYSADKRFQYPAGDFKTGCDLARNQGYDWDRCGF